MRTGIELKVQRGQAGIPEHEVQINADLAFVFVSGNSNNSEHDFSTNQRRTLERHLQSVHVQAPPQELDVSIINISDDDECLIKYVADNMRKTAGGTSALKFQHT